MVVALAVWYAARHSPHLAHAIARAPINNMPSASVTAPACPTCSASAKSSSVAGQWRRRRCTSCG